MTEENRKHPGAGPVIDEEGIMYFSGYDLARYELRQERILSAGQAINLKKAEMEAIKREFAARSTAINLDLGRLNSEFKQRKSSLLALQRELSDLYGIEDFSRVTYDDETGRINDIEYDEEGEIVGTVPKLALLAQKSAG